eukprot:Opistho-1_new@61179
MRSRSVTRSTRWSISRGRIAGVSTGPLRRRRCTPASRASAAPKSPSCSWCTSRFTSASSAGSAPARCCASCRACAVRASSSTNCHTRPQRSASAAASSCPSISRPLAFCRPTRRGSSAATPPVPNRPTCTSGRRRRAPRAATAMSPLSMSSSPAPTTQPCTATTTGCGAFTSAAASACSTSTNASVAGSSRSLPAQKARPSPPSRITRTAGSATPARTAASSSRARARVRALRRSGRFRRSSSTPSTSVRFRCMAPILTRKAPAAPRPVRSMRDGVGLQPLRQRGPADAGTGAGHQGALVDAGAEVEGAGIRHHLARVLAGLEHAPDQRVQRHGLGAGHFAHAVERRLQGHVGHRRRHVGRSDGLQGRRRQGHRGAHRAHVRDRHQELEELRGPHDGVWHSAGLDQRFLRDLGAEVAAVGQALRAHHRQRHDVAHASAGAGRQQVLRRGAEEMHHGVVLERGRVAHVHHHLRAGERLIQALAGDGVDA